MSLPLGRQPLIGDILHIVGNNLDTEAQILDVSKPPFIKIRVYLHSRMVLEWRGNEWIVHDKGYTFPVQIRIVERNQVLPYISGRSMRPIQGKLEISRLDSDKQLSMDQRAFVSSTKALDRHLIRTELENKSSDNDMYSMPIREQLYEKREAEEWKRRQNEAFAIANRNMKSGNPYLSQMAPSAADNVQAPNMYQDNRPGMNVNPNFDPKKFRLPRPKL